MSQANNIKPADQVSFGTNATYFIGFLLSMVLTIVGYLLVRKHIANHHLYPSDTFLTVALPLLAVVQLFAQLVFFLHLDRESKPRWNLLVLGFAVIVVLIILIGSLWIMNHLDYNMSPKQQNDYLLKQDGGI